MEDTFRFSFVNVTRMCCKKKISCSHMYIYPSCLRKVIEMLFYIIWWFNYSLTAQLTCVDQQPVV
ncbi:unnamed protein product [Musa acuminata subsp. malaccensis]|uniref:(wild Malaysian banana) hypothetical protein n=1 Tax=Musa acuminata subsp. malaccensis TaxID=214687 RepID=A0A804I9D5_MUSAM|nr:unnamed protein product [Musa acuminata subsp. malaccensis]